MKKRVIWVVDDDVIYQTIIDKLIKKSNAFLSHAAFKNGQEAIVYLHNTLEINKEHLPDIILLDINMPIMDGWQFMEEIKMLKSKFNKEIIIYIVSSSISTEDNDKSKSFSDITGYIPKPVSVHDLISISKN